VTILDCVKCVCDAADKTREQFSRLGEEVAKTITFVTGIVGYLRCVITGPAGQVCTLNYPRASSITLAEALARLNKTSVGAIATEHFTASAGQTAFTLTGAPAGSMLVEAALNGSILTNGVDYTVVGSSLTLAVRAVAGDELEARIFTI
jgi:hypothetical protein